MPRFVWCALLVAGLARADAPTPSALPLAADAWWIPGRFIPGRQPDGNTLVLRGPSGLVVLDTGRHARHREAILALAKAQGAPIEAIVNSHWHLDHVSGNPALKAAHPGVKVYASDAIDGALAGFLKESAAGARRELERPGIPPGLAEDLRGDLATLAEGAALRPDVVVKESATLSLAGRRLDVRLARQGATEGDVWLYDPATRIAAAGDLVTLPAPFFDTACVEGWRDALAEIAATPFERLLPGHGRPMTRAEFALYRQAWESFAACAATQRAAGECAAAWTSDAAPLLEANGLDPRGAELMAAYYVSQVLRPGQGRNRHCRQERRAGS